MKKGFKALLLALMIVCLAAGAALADAGAIKKAASAALEKINTLDASASNDIAIASIIHALTFASFGTGSAHNDAEYNAQMALNNAAQALAAPLDNASNDLIAHIKKLAPRSGATGFIDDEFKAALVAALTGDEIAEEVTKVEFNIEIGTKLGDGVAEKLKAAAEKLAGSDVKGYLATDGALAAYVGQFKRFVGDFEENAEYADSEEERIKNTNEKTNAEAFVEFYTVVSNDADAFTGMLSGISAYLADSTETKSLKSVLKYITDSYTDDGLVNANNAEAVKNTKAADNAAQILSPDISTAKDGSAATTIPANMGIVMESESAGSFTFDTRKIEKVNSVARSELNNLTARTAEIDSNASSMSRSRYWTAAAKLTKAVYPGTIFIVRLAPAAAAQSIAADENYIEDFVIAGINSKNLEAKVDTLEIDSRNMSSVVPNREYIITYSSLNGEIVNGFKDAVPLWGNIGGNDDDDDDEDIGGFGDDDADDDNATSSKSSSGGCAAGFGALALLALVPFVKVKKIRK